MSKNMQGEITSEMIRQHNLVDSLLNNFIFSKAKGSKKKLLFYDFKWAIQKHIFLENEVIFGKANLKDSLQVNLVKHLIREHEEIKSIIEDISSKLIAGKKFNAQDLKELLIDHETTEVIQLYPKMDISLTMAEKSKLLKNIKDIKLNKK